MVNLDRKVRNILLKKQLVTEDQAEKATQTAQQEACSLGKALIEMQAISEAIYLGALSEETNLPAVNLGRVEFEDQAVKSLPEDMAKYYCVLPIAKIGNILSLAMDDPTDIAVIKELQALTGFQINVATSTRAAFERGFARFYEKGPSG